MARATVHHGRRWGSCGMGKVGGYARILRPYGRENARKGTGDVNGEFVLNFEGIRFECSTIPARSSGNALSNSERNPERDMGLQIGDSDRRGRRRFAATRGFDGDSDLCRAIAIERDRRVGFAAFVVLQQSQARRLAKLVQ